MKQKLLLSIAVACSSLLAAGNASAYSTFSGVDANGNETALAATPNATAAETAFKSNLVGVGTENFESQISGAAAPLLLNFGAAGTATLSGSSGEVASVSAGSTNGVGRYSVPGGTKFWEIGAGGSNTFSIVFSQEIAALGFYGIDIGDFSGTLALQFLDDTNNLINTLNISSAAQNVANASVLYFGAIASNDSELFKSVNFVSSSGSGDFFGFDSFTIGAKEQVITNVPEPGSILLALAGLMGLSATRRRYV